MEVPAEQVKFRGSLPVSEKNILQIQQEKSLAFLTSIFRDIETSHVYAAVEIEFSFQLYWEYSCC